MTLVRPRYVDAFHPVLVNPESKSFNPTQEQRDYLWDILEVSCSDTRFAQKAYDAIVLLLLTGYKPLPEITSLNPSSATLGGQSFVLHVMGKNFGPNSQIIWNGSEEPTTYVSETELTTLVDMSTAEVAAQIPVMIQSGEGVLSAPATFNLVGPTSQIQTQSQTQQPQKSVEVTKSVEVKK